MTTRQAGRRRPTVRRRRGGSREPTMWTTASVSEVLLAVGGQTVLDLLGGFTLTEKHNISGMITAHVLFAFRGSVNVNTYGAMGLIAAEDDALAVPQVPEPFTDGDAPWALHQYFHWNEAAATQRTIQVQTRSRRKIGVKNSIAFVVDNASSSDSNLVWSAYIRVLLQRGR